MMTFTDALIIAAEAHRGTFDAGGVEYIKHPLHLVHLLKTRGYSEEYQVTALLHDVVEDTSVTESDLIEKGISSSVLTAIRLLTHVRDDGYIEAQMHTYLERGMKQQFAKIRAKEDEYMRYIRKIATNEIARAVKIVDLEHNADITRIKDSDVEDFATREYIGRRTMKYALARHFLTGGRVGY